MEYKILPIEKIIGQVILESESQFLKVSPTGNISFSWGDQEELIQWITAKDDEIAGMRAFNIGKKTKYPLIWLITPIDGYISYNENFIRNATFIIACNTEVEWLNEDREIRTMPMLTEIANQFIKVLQKNKNIFIPRKEGTPEINFKKIYNYPIASMRENVQQVAESEALEIWDAISLKFDLKINNNCLKSL